MELLPSRQGPFQLNLIVCNGANKNKGKKTCRKFTTLASLIIVNRNKCHVYFKRLSLILCCKCIVIRLLPNKRRAYESLIENSVCIGLIL